MNLIENTGEIVSEPDWSMLLSDEIELQAASKYWRSISSEMRGRMTLAEVNAHQMQRLVIAYILHDRASRQVLEDGMITKPRRGNSRAIARISPHFTAMREAGSDADRIEAELGISPRRRGSAGKVERKARSQRASDSYLRPVAK